MSILIIYAIIFFGAYSGYYFLASKHQAKKSFNDRKTVTFGDESAVTPNRSASVISIITLFFIWAAFTGSKVSPLHVPGPFTGDTAFTYSAHNAQNEVDSARVYIRVNAVDNKGQTPPQPEHTDAEKTQPKKATGFAIDDRVNMNAWRSKLIRVQKNDIGGRDKHYQVTAINGQLIAPLQTIKVDNGQINVTAKGSLSFTPDKGWQMEAIWLPPPEAVMSRFIDIAQNGYQNVSLFENIGWSLLRVIAGFLLGCLVGIPLGYAMGLNSWVRGWFDPVVEFMRPIPPLALIPLIIIWFGIWETGKISLLFLAALWIMTIAARAGVSGINISKIHAAYSLGASKTQVLIHIIIPNSLPDIFTGARVAMGVCWGTVVAAELVAAEKGAGKMIIAASKFQQTDVVIMGIILIGIIGYGIDVLMRRAENHLIPWKGKT
ncbi:Taurine transport system permease protein TauC [hydrothermal vent metagenome]|uniref:Taurine transport system permease protein TauC n=1 Tax=hydrothermal vent metagenome TaxID=652676 RepID=A0A3B0XCQ7_9ZZZZ